MAEAPASRLISDCIAGNEDAIETLVRQYEAGIFRLALSIVGDQAEASEITQETFVAALRSLPSYEERRSFKAWLYAIAVNHSRSHLRKRKVIERLRATLTTIFRVENQKQILPEEMVVHNEKESEIWKAIDQLDELHRVVLVLRYFHELPIAEILKSFLSMKEPSIRDYTVPQKLRNA
jgi:RNA polymerase sigma-70 factor (ECF subfamily)